MKQYIIIIAIPILFSCNHINTKEPQKDTVITKIPIKEIKTIDVSSNYKVLNYLKHNIFKSEPFSLRFNNEGYYEIDYNNQTLFRGTYYLGQNTDDSIVIHLNNGTGDMIYILLNNGQIIDKASLKVFE